MPQSESSKYTSHRAAGITSAATTSAAYVAKRKIIVVSFVVRALVLRKWPSQLLSREIKVPNAVSAPVRYGSQLE